MADLPQAVRDLCSRQHGVVTRRQLLDAGVTPAAVRWNAGRGWRVLLPSVFLLARDEPTADQRLVAALLWAGPSSVLAGATAARWYGVTSAEPGGTVHVLVPEPQRSRSRGFAVVRRTLLHDPAARRRGALRLSSPARAAVDAARTARSPDARSAILIEVVQRRLATLDDVAEWVHRLRTRDSARLQAPLARAASGAWSVPEADLLELMATSSELPDVWANPGLSTRTGTRLTTPDAWLDDVAMAVMVHSHRHHSQGEAWDDTVDLDADLVAAGVVVAGVTPRRIAREPGRVLRRLEETYHTAQRRPRPPVRATPRHGNGGHPSGYGAVGAAITAPTAP